MMQQINLPKTISGGILAPRSFRRLHNYYNVDGYLYPRSGWERYSKFDDGVRDTVGNGICKGLAVSADGEKLYSIFGQRLYVSTGVSSGIGAEVGLIQVSESIARFAVGFTGIAVSAGTRQYFIDTDTDTLTERTFDANFTTSDVSYVDGRYVWVQSGGDNLVYFSEVNDALDIPALNFFDAESRPDGNKISGVIGNDLYIFGDRTVERFRNTGSSTAPFARVTNSVIPVGYVGGKLNTSDRIMFIGRQLTGGVGIFSISGSSLNKISDRAVDEMLQYIDDTTSLSVENGLIQCESRSFVEYGREVNVFTIPAVNGNNEPSFTLAAIQGEDGYQWSILSSKYFSGHEDWGLESPAIGASSATKHVFDFINTVHFDNRWVSQRAINLDDSGLFVKSGLGFIDVSESDEFVTRGVLTQIKTPNDKPLEVSSIRIVYSSGVNSVLDFEDGAEVNIRVSNDERTWSTEKALPMVTGKKIQGAFAGGLISSDGHLGVLIETRAESPLIIEKVVLGG